MIIDKGIPIRNVYYMLTYAFKELRRNNYEQIAGEDFEDIYDLFAEILSLGISYLLKQGLHRRYLTEEEELLTLRGKLSIQQTIKRRMRRDTRLVCQHDNFSENNLFNQILKSSIRLLLCHSDVNRERKTNLRHLMPYLEGVEEIPASAIHWSTLRYDRNTRTYQMLHGLCYFLLNSKLLTTESGDVKMATFSDEHMNMLFQRFVLAFYQRRHPEYKPRAKQIKWDMREGDDSGSISMLPIMQTDITLTLGQRRLIMDTKYYSQTLLEHLDKMSLRSAHLYQIHTYVSNEDWQHTGLVDGMLLYARTEADIQPDIQFRNHDGNVFMARTLDLSQDFKQIEEELESLLDYDPTFGSTASTAVV